MKSNEDNTLKQVRRHVEGLYLVECNTEGQKRFLPYHCSPDIEWRPQDNEAYSRILVRLREKFELSIEAVCLLCGIDIETYKDIEAMPSRATNAQLVMIMDIYNMEPHFLRQYMELPGNPAGDLFGSEETVFMAFANVKTIEEADIVFDELDKQLRPELYNGDLDEEEYEYAKL